MSKTIGVVHGGLSHERQQSLTYGKKVVEIFKNLGMDVLELHLHPNGSWTVNGHVENIEESIKKVDSVWNCLVGVDGERGIVEDLCEKTKVKILGHSQLHTQLSGDKKNLQLALVQHSIKSPFGKVIEKKNFTQAKIGEIFTTVGVPAIVKPNIGSSTWGVIAVNNFTELKEAVEYLIEQNEDVLIEKIIKGISVSCFVFEHNGLLHTNIKVYEDSEKEDVLSREDSMLIRNEALYIHHVLAYNHHAEYDFILTPKKQLYFLEVNSHPSLINGYLGDVFKKGIINLSEYLQEKI